MSLEPGKAKTGGGPSAGGGAGRGSPDAALSGRLASVSLFDLCQFLMLNRKTGTLTVRSPEGTAYFTFQDGQLLTALNDALRDGGEVVMQAVQWIDGTFEFVAGPVPPDRRIHVSTENILLEAARRIDEMHEADGTAAGPAPTSQEKAFRERQERAGALSEAFRQAVSQGAGEPPAKDWRRAVLEGLVGGATQRVLLGPGDRICLLTPSGPRNLDGLPDGEVQEWIDELLPSALHLRKAARGKAGAGTAVRSWIGAGGARFWGERFRGPDGDWAVIGHPGRALPTYESLGLPGAQAAELEAEAAGGVLILGDPDCSVPLVATLLAGAARRRPTVGWVVESIPRFDWSVLPGRIRSLHPSLLSEPGALSEILDASQAEVQVLIDVRRGRLVADALRAAAGGTRLILLDRAGSWGAWLKRLDLRDAGLGDTGDGLRDRFRGLWTVRPGRIPGQIQVERAPLPGGEASRIPPRGPSSASPVR
jgi:hypothetical protein